MLYKLSKEVKVHKAHILCKSKENCGLAVKYNNLMTISIFLLVKRTSCQVPSHLFSSAVIKTLHIMRAVWIMWRVIHWAAINLVTQARQVIVNKSNQVSAPG